MLKSFGFEALERRDLLATDLLSGLSIDNGTLSSRPQNVISNGETNYFDARVDGTPFRQIFVSDGTPDGTRPIFEGQLEEAVFINQSLYFLHESSLHVANGTVAELWVARHGLQFGRREWRRSSLVRRFSLVERIVRTCLLYTSDAADE